MNRLRFEIQGPLGESAPNRVDIACFIGFVKRRNQPLPPELSRFLRERGYIKSQAESLLEVNATQTLTESIEFFADSEPLIVNVDGLRQEIQFAPGTYSSDEILSTINRNLVGGYARLIDGKLAIGIDSGRFGSLSIQRFSPFGFMSAAQSNPDDETFADVDLLNTPIPIESWELFDRVFAWDRRPVGNDETTATTYMGAAVRSFFAQGGKKCYIVQVDDPWPLETNSDEPETRRATLYARLRKLIPGFPNSVDVSPVDRQSWRGIGLLYDLSDVTFVCLPDLSDLVAAPIRSQDPPEHPIDVLPERFVECSESQPVTVERNTEARLIDVPRCDEVGYENWSRAVNLIGRMLASSRREMQLIAAIPIPNDDRGTDRSPTEILQDGNSGPLATSLRASPVGISSAFVQLAYPWVQTPGSENLPQQLESPEGVVAGLLARNALSVGTFRSAANSDLADVLSVSPKLNREQQESADPITRRNMLERITVLGETPIGLRLLSDVTTSLDESIRLASVNRLIASIALAARRLGEQVVFDSSGPELWTQIRRTMNDLLTRYFEAGALQGERSAKAFHVRCDRSTMSQNDIDNGRVIAEIRINPTANIERITVMLAMDEGGQISLVPLVGNSTEAA